MPAMTPPPSGGTLVERDGGVSRVWRPWFQMLAGLIGGEPFPLKSYTVAGVPNATAYEGHVIYVSNESGGKTLAFSDGADWRRVQDRNVIS